MHLRAPAARLLRLLAGGGGFSCRPSLGYASVARPGAPAGEGNSAPPRLHRRVDRKSASLPLDAHERRCYDGAGSAQERRAAGRQNHAPAGNLQSEIANLQSWKRTANLRGPRKGGEVSGVEPEYPFGIPPSSPFCGPAGAFGRGQSLPTGAARRTLGGEQGAGDSPAGRSKGRG